MCDLFYIIKTSRSGELDVLEAKDCDASAHSDYGMVTLLATDGVPGLQACSQMIS